jgi:hypothetical protein
MSSQRPPRSFLNMRLLPLKQPFDADAMLLAEARDLLVLQRQRRPDLLIGKIAGCGYIPDALAHGLFERAPLLELFRVHALLPRSACGVRSQKFNVIGNRPLDPLGLDVGVFVVAGFEGRALPCDFQGGRRGRGQLGHDRGVVFRNDGAMTSPLLGLMQAAFRQFVQLDAVNGAVHVHRGLPIFPDGISAAPVVAALLWLGLEPRRKVRTSPWLDFMVLHFMAKSNKVIPKKGRGRPATGRDPVTAIRLSAELRATVDKWAAKQDDAPGRSEAIRRLVELGLTVRANKPKQAPAARAERAKELASKTIDSLTVGAPDNDEHATRKRRLIKGPEEFRELRVDRAKTK